MLCDVEGLTYEEIAGILDAKLGTVRSRIHRGRAMLRKALAHRAPGAGRVALLRARHRPDPDAAGEPVMRHLGSRASALLDGQLSPEETERAWAHVHACHACRDLVEREGWIKTRLAGLSAGATAAPEHLKGSLLGPHAHTFHLDVLARRSRSWAGLAIGGGRRRGGRARACWLSVPRHRPAQPTAGHL